MTVAELLEVPARTLAAWIAEGRVGLEECAETFMARIAEREPEIRAWAFHDPDHVRRQLERLEFERRLGRPKGPLFGLPVGLKDIFDTEDMPTEHGCRFHAGRRPTADSWVARRLRAAGALLMGKTVTSEMACMTPGPTRNPRDPSRTPGGSSMGSAAAVADRMVPLAVGSQTAGSVIRPASFCGVYGFKPSFGLIPRSGCLMQSELLDHVGVFASSLVDLAFFAEVLIGDDPGDPATRPRAALRLPEIAGGDPPLPPKLAFLPGPGWERAEACVREGFGELAEALGEALVAVELPAPFERAVAAHRTLWTGDLAWHYRREFDAGPDALSEHLRGLIEEGRAVPAYRHHEARAIRDRCRRILETLFVDFDAVVTPAALGEAPGPETTGDPICCTPWTFAGLPAVTLPLLEGPNGLPVGVQLVGAHDDDARLLRTAAWLERRLTREETA